MNLATNCTESTTNERSLTNAKFFLTRLGKRKMIKTFQKLLQGQGSALILLSSVILFGGCATLTFKQPEPVTIGQVIEMNKHGVPPGTIIEKMRGSQSVYRLTAAQLAELHDLGIADQVLDYMQQTYIEAERREQSNEDWGEQDIERAGF